MKKNFINLTGFTLVEVMVVVFIITILVSITAISFKSVRVKGRDTKRVDTINTVHQALQAYYNDEGIYPTTLTFGQPLKNILGTKTYLDEVPKNPTPRVDHGCPDNEYIYTVGANNKSYSLAACIGADNNPNSGKMIYGSQEGIFNCGDTITDRDNFTYKTASINNKCWLIEDLKTITKPDGTCINPPVNTDIAVPPVPPATVSTHYYYTYTISPAPGCVATSSSGTPPPNTTYNDNSFVQSGRSCIIGTGYASGTESSCIANGAIYTWDAAMNYPTLPTATGYYVGSTFNPVPLIQNILFKNYQGICPDGGHIPTPNDFTSLELSACISATCATDFPYDNEVPLYLYVNTATGTRGTTEGTRLIGPSTTFNGSLLGKRDPGSVTPPWWPGWYTTNVNNYWVSEFEIVNKQGYRRSIFPGGGVERKGTNKLRAYPVRCVKN